MPSQTRARLLASSPDQMYRTLEQSPHTLLSEFSEFLSGNKQLDVPVYTVWGACEDVAIIEKFRHGEYHIDNLFLLDEASTHVLDVGGVSLRLFGLGGAVVQHKLFDNGEGNPLKKGPDPPFLSFCGSVLTNTWQVQTQLLEVWASCGPLHCKLVNW